MGILLWIKCLVYDRKTGDTETLAPRIVLDMQYRESVWYSAAVPGTLEAAPYCTMTNFSNNNIKARFCFPNYFLPGTSFIKIISLWLQVTYSKGYSSARLQKKLALAQLWLYFVSSIRTKRCRLSLSQILKHSLRKCLLELRISSSFSYFRDNFFFFVGGDFSN